MFCNSEIFTAFPLKIQIVLPLDTGGRNLKILYSI
jgi:hypothetical protein